MNETASRRRFLLIALRRAAALGLFRAAAAYGKDTDPTSYDGVLRALTGGRTPEASGELVLDVPDSAENGAIVPVTLASRIDRTAALHLLVVHNPRPLAASFSFLDGAVPSVSFRIKMNESSEVVALAEAGGRLYWTRKQVRVAVGGCG
ncbi:thiosulfate oxidation carrier protein SoxY [Methylococcus geothermalis]|uniref:Sulfur compound-chelating protein SoxY n=1 Tax=Methylococcus geothermalis TaxID=2681310 RepID=A0A858Q7H4_9GAMM|nr:thiosulfate oxidation carrier protein SoxY [Methylococcus geothermalis]QJD29780.1 sulfur compound-chelating protein SoxY [Methylococcus geothermalis]